MGEPALQEIEGLIRGLDPRARSIGFTALKHYASTPPSAAWAALAPLVLDGLRSTNSSDFKIAIGIAARFGDQSRTNAAIVAVLESQCRSKDERVAQAAKEALPFLRRGASAR